MKVTAAACDLNANFSRRIEIHYLFTNINTNAWISDESDGDVHCFHKPRDVSHESSPPRFSRTSYELCTLSESIPRSPKARTTTTRDIDVQEFIQPTNWQDVTSTSPRIGPGIKSSTTNTTVVAMVFRQRVDEWARRNRRWWNFVFGIVGDVIVKTAVFSHR